MSENHPEPIALPKAGDLLAEKYRIKKLLGRGGMGAVYQAQHEILDRPVAIKFLLPSIAEHPQAVARFLNEARASARLSNEHVAAVLDVGTMPNGCAFMVLEYLEGHDLAQTLETRGSLPVSEAVEYVLQSLEALAQAHAAGIVHRDLKPANLFLTRRPDGLPIVKVLDFGISKAATASNVTATSSMLGSPSYMSPEQIKSSKHVDPRSDIWSMGVVLYQLLSAQLPFKGEGFGEVFAAIFDGSYPPLESLRPELPPGVCAAVARCLKHDREQRFQNVGELADSLKSFAFPTGELCVERIHRLLAAPQIQAAAAAAAAEPLPPPRAAPTPSNLDSPTQASPSADPKGNAETASAPAAAADVSGVTVIRPHARPNVVPAPKEALPTAASSSDSELEQRAFPRKRGRWIVAAAVVVLGAAAVVMASGALDAGPEVSDRSPATPVAPAPGPLPRPAPAAAPAPTAEAREPAIQPLIDSPAADPVLERPASPAEPALVAKPAVVEPARVEPALVAKPAVVEPARVEPAKVPGQPRPTIKKATSTAELPAAAPGDEMLLDRR